MAKPRERTVPVAMTTNQTAAGSWLRGFRFSGFSLLMMGMLILAVVVLAPTLRDYIEQQQQIAAQQAAVNTLKTQVGQLDSQRARWTDPSYIRAQARARLYYVMPGDVSYLIIDDRPAAAKTADDVPVTKNIQTTPTDWVGSLFGSFMNAGLSNPTPAQLSGSK
jgi:cell division protein FtsB